MRVAGGGINTTQTARRWGAGTPAGPDQLYGQAVAHGSGFPGEGSAFSAPPRGEGPGAPGGGGQGCAPPTFTGSPPDAPADSQPPTDAVQSGGARASRACRARPARGEQACARRRRKPPPCPRDHGLQLLQRPFILAPGPGPRCAAGRAAAAEKQRPRPPRGPPALPARLRGRGSGGGPALTWAAPCP